MHPRLKSALSELKLAEIYLAGATQLQDEELRRRNLESARVILAAALEAFEVLPPADAARLQSRIEPLQRRLSDLTLRSSER